MKTHTKTCQCVRWHVSIYNITII